MSNRIFKNNSNMIVQENDCDVSGVLNTSMYVAYCEYARLEYLKNIQVNLEADDASLSIIKIEIDHLQPLCNGDEFFITTSTERAGDLKIKFNQRIYRKPDEELIASAILIGEAFNKDGVSYIPKELEGHLKES